MSCGRCSMTWWVRSREVASEWNEEGRNEVKSHERLKAEGRIERLVEDMLWSTGHIDMENRYRSEDGDFLIEIRAHYLGSKSKRLTEPADDVVD